MAETNNQSYWDVLGEVRALSKEIKSGNSEGEASLMVALDKLTDTIKSGIDFTDKVEELLVLLQLPLELPNVVMHITVLFALCHVLRRAIELPGADDLLKRTQVMDSIMKSLGSQKREVRDAAGQALGSVGIRGAKIILSEVLDKENETKPWEHKEGQAMALGYIGASKELEGGDGEVFNQLFGGLLPLLKLTSAETSAMSGNGAVLQHACRGAFWMMKDKHGREVEVPKEIMETLEGLLSHAALEVRREAAFAMSQMSNTPEWILSKVKEFSSQIQKGNGLTGSFQVNTSSEIDYLKLHGVVIVIRHYSENEGASSENMIDNVLPFLNFVVDHHINNVIACDIEGKGKLSSGASFSSADALRSMANIIIGCQDVERKKSLLKQFFTNIKGCFSSSDTYIVDAALRVTQSISRSEFSAEELEQGMEGYVASFIKSVTIWVYALQYHPAIVIKVASVEVLSTMRLKGYYDDNFGLRLDGKGVKGLLRNMIKLVFSFIGESYELLKTSSSNDLRETILKASLSMFRKLSDVAARNEINIQRMIERDGGKRALLEDFALLVIDKTINGFVGSEEGALDFARPSAAECLEVFVNLFSEYSTVIDKMSDSKTLVPLAFLPDDVSCGIMRMIGALAEHYPSRLPFMSFLAVMLGVVSPISKTSVSTLSILPALSSIAKDNKELITTTLVNGIKRHIIPLSLGDSSELEGYLSSCNENFMFSPLDPFMCTAGLAVFKYGLLMGSDGELTDANNSVALAAVLTALSEGSDEFKSKEFAAAILYETDLDSLYKANNLWGDVIGVFLSKLNDTENGGDVQMEIFPDSGEIGAVIGNVVDTLGEEEVEGTFNNITNKYKSMPEIDETCPDNEKLVWSIVNRRPINLDEFPIYSSFVTRDVPCDEGVYEGVDSIRTRDDAVAFIRAHKGKAIGVDELKRISRLLIDEDLGDEERLALIPVLLSTNVGLEGDAVRFPNLPMEVQVLDEGKRNEGFASDSQFAAMK